MIDNWSFFLGVLNESNEKFEKIVFTHSNGVSWTREQRIIILELGAKNCRMLGINIL